MLRMGARSNRNHCTILGSRSKQSYYLINYCSRGIIGANVKLTLGIQRLALGQELLKTFL
jgi:hypothetical protein